MKAIFRKILYFLGLEGISRILLMESSLKEDGWFLSVKKKQAVDKNGQPIPWVTYPFIDFIKNRINNTMDVFEFGAGNSSLFFANRAKSVVSIEHHPDWFKQIKSDESYNLGNLDIKLVEIPSELAALGYHKMAFTDAENEYVLSLRNSGKKFDIVVVDGLFRNSCIMHSIDNLTDKGVIFLDNTSKHYENLLKQGTDMMAEKGFKRIDFHGIGPIYSRKSCTSVFYRSNNCLGI